MTTSPWPATCLAVLLVGGAGAAIGEKLPEPILLALETITAQDAQGHEELLASNEYGGRDTPSKGLTMAGEYLVKQYESYGLAGAGEQGSYYFPFDVPVRTYDENDHLAVVDLDGELLDAFGPGQDFVPIRGSASGEVEGDLVFCGYGIQDQGEKYDDYRGVKVKGKVVLVLSHEPRQNKKGRAFKGLEATWHSRYDSKAETAQELGAVAVIVVSNPLHCEEEGILPAEHPRWSWGQTRRRRRGSTQVPEITIPLVHVSRLVAEELIGVETLRGWQETIDKKLRGQSVEIPDKRIKLKVTMADREMPVQNVVAMLPGTDPVLKDEWIILGAHYDHIGTDPYGEVFNGADDNASGTACLLEVAQALASDGVQLRRSVMFMHFAAEEKGLRGAYEYCQKPLIPLENTIAMFNMDMVGRGRPNHVDAVGLSYSKDFESYMRKAVSAVKTRIRVGKDGMQYFQRSDQLPFWQAGVPVLFFMEPEEHEDYHQVTDTVDKVDMEKIAKVGRVVMGLTYLVSEADDRPEGRTGKRD